MKIKDILVASNNENKLKEIRDIFSPYNITIHSPKELNLNIDPDETGSTYFENALIKCNAFKEYVDYPVISDDSGIEIEALGNHYPGIHSHRYMEELGGQVKCIEYVAKNYLGSKCKFHSSIVCVNLDNKPLEFVGEVNGTITEPKVMSNFGYDPIFKINSINKTYSEIPSYEKDKLSHRYLALISFIEYLKNNNYI